MKVGSHGNGMMSGHGMMTGHGMMAGHAMMPGLLESPSHGKTSHLGGITAESEG